jgi:hypothetical protein
MTPCLPKYLERFQPLFKHEPAVPMAATGAQAAVRAVANVPA